MEAIENLFTASLWAAAIRIASPLIFGTLGELICERAGVLNLGIEGIMTVGAFAGWLTVYHRRRPVDRRCCRCAGGRGVRRAAWLPDGAARPVAACHGHRHHASCHVALLLFLSPGVPESSPRRRRSSPSSPCAFPVLSDIPVSGRSAVQPDAADLSGVRLGRPRRLGAPPNAHRSGHPRRSAKTRRRRRRRASMSRWCAWARSCWAAPSWRIGGASSRCPPSIRSSST